MGKAVLIGLLLTGACRLGFDPEDRPQDRQIECTQTPRFTVIDNLTAVSAVATSAGFAVFATDANKALLGWTYEWDRDKLENVADYAMLDADITGGFGAVASGNKILLAATHGIAETLGTTYYPLSQLLDDRAPRIVTDQQAIGAMPLAESSSTAAIRFEGGSVVVNSIDMLGGSKGAHIVADSSVGPSELSLAPAGTGFVASWVAAAPSPNITQLAVLDDLYNVVARADVFNTAGFDTIRPRVRFAATSKTYLVAWFEKTPTGDDDTYIQVLDKSLAPVIAPTRIATSSVRPVIATDGDGFFVAYKDGPTNRMAAVHVGADGAITPRSIASSGAPTAWSMLERAGQPVLVHADSASNLWFAPLCP